MIADLDQVIRQLMIDELPIRNGEIAVEFDQPKREWSARLSRPTINFFLYDLRENPHLRQHQWEAVNVNNGGANRTRQKRTPLRYDCYYILTAWVPGQPIDEHRLLTRAMLTLAKNPILPQERFHGSIAATQEYEIPTRLANHDVLPNPSELWSALDNELRPSISYVVTITLDPWQEVEGPAVITFSFASGHEVRPGDLRDRRLEPDTVSLISTTIGGVARSKRGDRVPQAGLEVEIADTGLYTRTDALGRFRFSGLVPGSYTLIARPSGGKAVTKAVNIPAREEETYDLEV